MTSAPSDREALGAALVLLDRTEHALRSGLADIQGVIAELERLDRIGKTRFDALTAADLAWLNAHPLKPWGDAVPALVRWLNDRIGGDER